MAVDQSLKMREVVMERFKNPECWDITGMRDYPPTLFFMSGTKEACFVAPCPSGARMEHEMDKVRGPGVRYHTKESTHYGDTSFTPLQMVEFAEQRRPGAKKVYCTSALKRRLRREPVHKWEGYTGPDDYDFELPSSTDDERYIVEGADLWDVAKYAYGVLKLFKVPGRFVSRGGDLVYGEFSFGGKDDKERRLFLTECEAETRETCVVS